MAHALCGLYLRRFGDAMKDNYDIFRAGRNIGMTIGLCIGFILGMLFMFSVVSAL